MFDDTVPTKVQPSKLKTCCARSWLSSNDGKSTEVTKKTWKFKPKIRFRKSFITIFAIFARICSSTSIFLPVHPPPVTPPVAHRPPPRVSVRRDGPRQAATCRLRAGRPTPAVAPRPCATTPGSSGQGERLGKNPLGGQGASSCCVSWGDGNNGGGKKKARIVMFPFWGHPRCSRHLESKAVASQGYDVNPIESSHSHPFLRGQTDQHSQLLASSLNHPCPIITL